MESNIVSVTKNVPYEMEKPMESNIVSVINNVPFEMEKPMENKTTSATSNDPFEMEKPMESKTTSATNNDPYKMEKPMESKTTSDTNNDPYKIEKPMESKTTSDTNNDPYKMEKTMGNNITLAANNNPYEMKRPVRNYSASSTRGNSESAQVELDRPSRNDSRSKNLQSVMSPRGPQPIYMGNRGTPPPPPRAGIRNMQPGQNLYYRNEAPYEYNQPPRMNYPTPPPPHPPINEIDLENELPEGLIIPQRGLSCDPQELLLQKRRREQIENNGLQSETLDRKWYNIKPNNFNGSNNNINIRNNNPLSNKKTQIPPFSLSSTLGYKY